MFQATRNIVQKFGSSASAKATAVGTSLLVPVLARADDADATAIVASVNEAMTNGKTIALAIVMGLFAIFAIKLLWRAK